MTTQPAAPSNGIATNPYAASLRRLSALGFVADPPRPASPPEELLNDWLFAHQTPEFSAWRENGAP